MELLRTTPKYFNTYEAVHEKLANNKWFNERDWELSANTGELDQYITALANSDKINEQALINDYLYEYSDDKTRLASIYNEVFADRENTNKERSRYKYNENGEILKDENNKPIIENYTASDYDYNKSIIRQANEINYKKYIIQQEQERKDSISGFAKHMATLVSIPLEFAKGVFDTIDGIGSFVAASIAGTDAAFRGENVTDAMVRTNASNEGRLFESLGTTQLIVDFERRYSYIRDLDGNYSAFGKIAGGIAYTFGQMAIPMIAGKAAGKITSSFLPAANQLNNTAKIVSTVTKATSSIVFYSAITANNVRDIYRELAKNGASVSSGAIIANATLKSMFQYMIEIYLTRFLGGSTLDSLVFGRSVSTSAAKTLGKDATNRLLRDFVEEGLEEVFQDTSDFLVDQAFEAVTKENFGEITDLTWQSLMDAFIIGGLASVSGSAAQIVSTKKIVTPNIKKDSLGNVVRYKNDVIAKFNRAYKSDVKDADGNIIHKKGDIYQKKGDVIHKAGDVQFETLGKLQSWAYGLNMQSFMENFATLQRQGEQIIRNYNTSMNEANTKQGKKYAAAFTEMYAAYRMIASIYENIGDERFDAANRILTTITDMINAGKFNSLALKSASRTIMSLFEGMQADAQANALRQLQEASMTELVTAIERGDTIDNIEGINKNVIDEVKNMLNGSDEINRVALMKDGTRPIVIDDTAFVPINYITNSNGEVIFSSLAEEKLVKTIIKGSYRGLVLEQIKSLFIEVTGNEKATMEEAVLNLLFNDSFFRIVLSTANRDTYEFVSSLIGISESVVPDKLQKKVYKQKILTVVSNMRTAITDYLCNQTLAEYKQDILLPEQIKRIQQARFCKNLYERVINKATFKVLKDSDWEILNNRVNYMPINKDEKETILKKLHSDNSDTRASAMNRIASVYRGIFTTLYDGKTYMPDNGIPNRTFNVFLRNNGITIETLRSTELDPKLLATIANLYGEVNEDTVVQYWQEQFRRYTGNRFSFRFDNQYNVGVFEFNTNKQVGFSAYASQYEAVVQGKNMDKRTFVERSYKRNSLVQELLDKNVDKATAAYLSIDHVITDPSLLSEQIKADIEHQYKGVVNIETTFMYLRNYFLDKLKDTTVVLTSDGSYAFATVKPMKSILLNEKFKINKNAYISQYIKPAYLYGRLERTRIVLVDSTNIVAEYNSKTNSIYINKTFAERGGNALTFALLHEFQHAVQVENSMNIGMNANWINSKNLKKTTRDSIIKDVRKHRPELFKDVEKGSKQEAEIVNDFVYFSSGESTAYGIDASKLLDYYPTQVYDSSNGTRVRLPWGTEYKLTEGLPMSLLIANDIYSYDYKLSKDEKNKYINLIYSVRSIVKNDNRAVNTMLKKYFFENVTTNDLKNEIIKVYINALNTLWIEFGKLRDYDTGHIVNVKNLSFELLKCLCNYVLDYGYDNFLFIDNYDSFSILIDDIQNSLMSIFELFVNKVGIKKIYNEKMKTISYDELPKYLAVSTEQLLKLRQKYDDVEVDSYLDTIDFVRQQVLTKSLIVMPDIKLVVWSNIDNIPDERIGIMFSNIIRVFSELNNYPLEYNTASVLAHELIHYLTVNNIHLNLMSETSKDLYRLCESVRRNLILKKEYSQELNSQYALTDTFEFMAEITNIKFIHILNSNNFLMDSTKLAIRSAIDTKIDENASDLVYVTELVKAFISSIDIQNMSNAFNIVTGINFSSTEKLLRDFEENSGGMPSYFIDKNGATVMTNDYRSYLGKLDESNNMSIRADSDSEQRLQENIVNDLKEMLAGVKGMTADEAFENLKNKYEFVPEDVLADIVNEYYSDEIAKSNKPKVPNEVAEKLEDAKKENDKFEKSEVNEKYQNRRYEEPQNGENVIENKSKHGKWIKKIAKVDENGEYLRNKDGKIIYTYVYNTKSRYVGQKASSGTNLEKYGYTGKYKRNQLSEDMQHFIVNATDKIDEDLWDLVKSGKINETKIMEYFMAADNIDDATFKLINDSFFKNTKIKTFKDLERYVELKTSEYFAMASMIKSLRIDESFATSTNPKSLDKFNDIIDTDEKLKSIKDKLVAKYQSIDVNKGNLRRLWMYYFDGSAVSAAHIANIAKLASIFNWQITGDSHSKKSVSMDSQVTSNKSNTRQEQSDITFADTVADTSAQDAFDAVFNSADREQKVQEIMTVLSPKIVKRMMAQGATQREMEKTIHEKWQKLMDQSDETFAKNYAKFVKNMTDEEINALFKRQMIANIAGVDVNSLNDSELEKLSEVTNKIFENKRTSNAIKNNIIAASRTIKSLLSPKSKKLFLELNSDLFDDNLKVKQEQLKDKTFDELKAIEDRIKSLRTDVRRNVYESTRALEFKKKMDVEVAKLKKRNMKLTDAYINAKAKTVVVYEIADDAITVNTTQDMPAPVKRLLETTFSKGYNSKVQYLTEGDEHNLKTSLKEFTEQNATFLGNLTQAEIDLMADFYISSEIMPGSSKIRTYSAVQLYTIAYLLTENKKGTFTLTEEREKALNDKLKTIVSVSEQNAANWRAVLKWFKPAEIITQSIAKKFGINFTESDVQNLVSAITSGDKRRIDTARKIMYDNGLKQYKGSKKSFWSKLLDFQRTAMLSSPGTWIRNVASNEIVTLGNRASERIGTAVSSLIEKMFPKKQWKREKQYKIVGTKVTSEVQTFIQKYVIESRLFDLVNDGLNKYNPSDTQIKKFTNDETLTEILSNSIASKIFTENSFDSKMANNVRKFILKMLSDEKWINKTTIRYFGKILVEDNVDISQGLTKDVLTRFAEAYKLAAFDYMHKTNFFNTIEAQIKDRFGDAGYFVYKQVLPFAGASWNWFVEGLKYTPVGLIKAIVNFAKLENTIERMDNLRKEGKGGVSSRFAEYLARRDIGKGVMGSVGTAIGILLASFGLAGLDDEDDKLKLFVGSGPDRVSVDISKLFGTQGILLGIGLTDGIKNGKWTSIIGDTLDIISLDSTFSDVFNSFRYSDDFGDWLAEAPYRSLNMMIPNFLKLLSSVSMKYKIEYSKGLLGKLEKLAVDAIPGLGYAFPTYNDPYTGEKQTTYKLWILSNMANKLLPVKIQPYYVSEIEKEALSVGVRRQGLSRTYIINDEKHYLNSSQHDKMNEFYGKLNKKDLDELMSNKRTYKVRDKKTGKYVELTYSKMTNEQKNNVINRIMDDNSYLAKIYILTSSNEYKYYADEETYKNLKSIGVKQNVYKETNKYKGFVKN